MFNYSLVKLVQLELADNIATSANPNTVLFVYLQTQYNKKYDLLVSSGVEKMVKFWSVAPFVGCVGDVNKKCETPLRPHYTRNAYIELVLQSNQMGHGEHEADSTGEDPRMLAFFDSLLQHDLALSPTDSSSDEDNDDFPFGQPLDDDIGIMEIFLPRRNDANEVVDQRRRSERLRLQRAREEQRLQMRVEQDRRSAPPPNQRQVANDIGVRTRSQTRRLNLQQPSAAVRQAPRSNSRRVTVRGGGTTRRRAATRGRWR